MQDAVIGSAVRTAVGRGKRDGSLANVHPVDLSALVIQEAVKRADIDPRTIDDVFWGCAMPEGSQGLNVARLAVRRTCDRSREGDGQRRQQRRPGARCEAGDRSSGVAGRRCTRPRRGR